MNQRLWIHKNDLPTTQPRNGRAGLVKGCFAQDRVMRPLVEMDDDRVLCDLDASARFHELAVEVFRLGFAEAVQLAGEPAVATVGDHREGDIDINVEPYLAGQAIEMEEVDADAETVFYAVAAGITEDEVAGSNLGVVRHKQGDAFATQAANDHLAQRSLVAVQSDPFVQVTDVFVQAFGNVEVGRAPRTARQLFE